MGKSEDDDGGSKRNSMFIEHLEDATPTEEQLEVRCHIIHIHAQSLQRENSRDLFAPFLALHVSSFHHYVGL